MQFDLSSHQKYILNGAFLRYAQSKAWSKHPEAFGVPDVIVRKPIGRKRGEVVVVEPKPSKFDLDAAIDAATEAHERLTASSKFVARALNDFARRTAQEKGIGIGVLEADRVTKLVEPMDPDEYSDAVIEDRLAARAFESTMLHLLQTVREGHFNVPSQGRVRRLLSQSVAARFLEGLNIAAAQMAVAAAIDVRLPSDQVTIISQPTDPRHYYGVDPIWLQAQGMPASLLGGRWNGEAHTLFSFLGAAVEKGAAIATDTDVDRFGLSPNRVAKVGQELEEKALSSGPKSLAPLVGAKIAIPHPSTSEDVRAIEPAVLAPVVDISTHRVASLV